MNIPNRHGGFTLVEMAMVLLILGLLTRSLIQPLINVRSHNQHKQTISQLENIKQALLAYVVAHGALPCPLSVSNSQDEADGVVDGRGCLNSVGGLPAAQIAIEGAVNENGALLDEWGRAYQYIVSSENHESKGDVGSLDWTFANDASVIGIKDMVASLVLCSRTVTSRCAKNATRASNIVFVVLSQGNNINANTLQNENVDGDNVFLLSEHSIETRNIYDDYLTWSSAEEALYWMLRAGWLP